MRSTLLVAAAVMALMLTASGRVVQSERERLDYDEYPGRGGVGAADELDVDDSDELTLSSTLSFSEDTDFLFDSTDSVSLSITSSNLEDFASSSSSSSDDEIGLAKYGDTNASDESTTDEPTLTPLASPTHEGVYIGDSMAANVVPPHETAIAKALDSASGDDDTADSSAAESVDEIEHALFTGVRVLDDSAVQQITLFSMQVSQAYRDAFFGALLSVFTVGTLAILIVLAHAVRRRQWYELHHPHPTENIKHPYEEHPHAPIHIV